MDLLCKMAVHAVSIHLKSWCWIVAVVCTADVQLYLSTLDLCQSQQSSLRLAKELIHNPYGVAVCLAANVHIITSANPSMMINDDQDLGWSLADTDALCAPSTSPAADAATASNKGKPPAAAKKPATADKTAPATPIGQMAPMTDEIVNGFQTPCHVAAIQCHKAAVEQLNADMTAAVSILKDSMYAWQQNEAANKERWAICLKNLEDVV